MISGGPGRRVPACLGRLDGILRITNKSIYNVIETKKRPARTMRPEPACLAGIRASSPDDARRV